MESKKQAQSVMG
jgi:hypothetical protein